MALTEAIANLYAAAEKVGKGILAGAHIRNFITMMLAQNRGDPHAQDAGAVVIHTAYRLHQEGVTDDVISAAEADIIKTVGQ